RPGHRGGGAVHAGQRVHHGPQGLVDLRAGRHGGHGQEQRRHAVHDRQREAGREQPPRVGVPAPLRVRRRDAGGRADLPGGGRAHARVRDGRFGRGQHVRRPAAGRGQRAREPADGAGQGHAAVAIRRLIPFNRRQLLILAVLAVVVVLYVVATAAGGRRGGGGGDVRGRRRAEGGGGGTCGAGGGRG